MQKNSKKGFTLIEILVVMGIIAILAAIVLIAINPARQFAQARNTQRTSNVNAILNAIGQYVADNQGNLPSDVNGSVDEITDDLCEDLVPNYLPALPTDPASDSEGEAIEEDDCDTVGSNDVEYDVGTTTGNRVQVCADNAADESEALGTTTAPICVVR